jgi:hypothetical protein
VLKQNAFHSSLQVALCLLLQSRDKNAGGGGREHDRGRVIVLLGRAKATQKQVLLGRAKATQKQVLLGRAKATQKQVLLGRAKATQKQVRV